jgi:hypothetical protein
MHNRLEELLAGRDDFSTLLYHDAAKVLLLVETGERAKLLHDFLAAVGRYVAALKHEGEGEREDKRCRVQALFDQLLDAHSA